MIYTLIRYALDIAIVVLFIFEHNSQRDTNEYRFVRIWIEVELINIVVEPVFF